MRPLRLLPMAAALVALAATPSPAQFACPPAVRYAPPAYAHYAQYPAQKVVAQNIAVAPLIVAVPVDSKAVPAATFGAPYYYSVSDAFQAKSTVRDVIREELRNFVQDQAPARATAPPAAPPPPAPAPAPAPADGPPPIPEPEAAATAAVPEALEKQVLAAFQGRGNCLNCHGPLGRQALKLVDDEDRLLPLSADKRWKVYGMVSAGAMPPAATKDTSKAVEVEHLPALLRWASLK